MRFALVGMLFLIFDVEALFFYPWAVILRDLGWDGILAVLSFFVVLGVGYVYARAARRAGLAMTSDDNNGRRAEGGRHATPESARRLGARIVDLAGDLRPGVLRHRDDRRRRGALRHGALRLRAVPRLARARPI